MPMTEAEKGQKRAQIQAMISECQANIVKLEEELTRLEAVEPIIYDAKFDVVDLQTHIIAKLSQAEWRGQNRDDFLKEAQEGLFKEMTDYIVKLDELIERLTDLIKEKKDKIKAENEEIEKLQRMLLLLLI